MKTTDLNIAPFHKVDMSSYLSDPRYESVMIPFCKFTAEYSECLLVECVEQLTPTYNVIDCILDDMEIIASIGRYCKMYLNRYDGGYVPFYLPKWFLIELLKEECKQRAGDLIPFTISLIRECNQ